MPNFSENEISEAERGFTPPEKETLKPPETEAEIVAEGPERTEQQALSELGGRADEEFAAFEAGETADFSAMVKTGAALGFSEAAIGGRLVSSGSRSTLDRIQDSAVDAYRGFKKVLAVGLGAAALTSAQEARPDFSAAEQLKPQAAQEQIIKSEKKETAPKLTTPQIREQLMTEKNERAYLSLGEAENEFEEIAVGNNNSFRLDLPALREKIPPGVSQATLTHTHPFETLGAVFGYPPEQTAKMRSGEVPYPQLPPSGLDLALEAPVSHLLQKTNPGMRVKGRVMEPSGTWEYSMDPGNSLVKTFGEAQKRANELAKTFTAGLSANERRQLAEDGWDITKHDMSIFDNRLDKKQTRKIFEKYLRFLKKHDTNNPELNRALASVADIEQVAAEMRNSTRNNHSPETRQGLLNMYTGLCRQNGIEMAYKPYQANAPAVIKPLAERPNILKDNPQR